jgi:class 3 adenylate cyclase/tetratricopeptide (TPR) repeat protein
MDVTVWLRGLGMEQYEEAFRTNHIDAEVLTELTADDLSAIGVISIGHRRKLLAAIAALRAGSRSPNTVEAAVQTEALFETEFRQVTVLFVDLVGFTKLTEELDPEEMQAVLGRFFEMVDRIIISYGGAIDKHIGDCVMAVFGAPIAYGDDSERGVRAALDIRDGMSSLSNQLNIQLDVHIGVAAGAVVASGVGSPQHRAYTVTGESVNLAARLTDKAAKGEILIADAVYRDLTDRIECADRGELTVEGASRPVRTWHLKQYRKPERSRQRPFVGRQGELRQLKTALAACRSSGAGQTIYIRGEPGIGKTRLLEEVKASALAEGFAAHGGLVLSFGSGTGQDATRSLVRSVLDLTEMSSGDAVVAAAAQAITAGLVEEESRVFLNDLLDLQQPPELRSIYDAMDTAARNRGKRAFLRELVKRASVRQPRLLTIEDLHWADQMTLDHMATLITTVAECPAILIMTSRMEGDPLDYNLRPMIAGGPLATIELPPLRDSEAAVLADDYLRNLGQLAQRCLDRAGGNPLFLEQLLRHAEESADNRVPGSIQSLVQARLDQLEPSDKQALQTASIFGQRFSLDGLQAVLGRKYDCAELIRHFLVHPHEDHYLFAHALIQEGVYRSMVRSRQHSLHRRAADWFASRDLTLHAEHLDMAENENASQAYLAAARAQAAEYRTDQALRLVERGLALAKARTEINALTQFHGELLHDLGSIPQSLTAFEQALETAETDVERCRARLGLAAGMRVIDRFDEAFDQLNEAEALAQSSNLRVELARLHHLRGNLCFPLGKLEECLHEHQSALDLARAAGATEYEARALGGLGDGEYARGRMASAHHYFSRCVKLAKEHGAGRVEVANLSMVAHTEIYLARFPAALQSSQAAVELAARVSHNRAEIIAHNAAINTFRSIGEYESAEPHVESTLRLARSLGAKRFEGMALHDQAMVLAAQGHRTQALDSIRAGLAISREAGLNFVGPWILGHLAVLTDDHYERREALTEGECILAEGAVGHNHLWFRRYAIETSIISEEWEEAERHATELAGYTHSEPLPWADFFIAFGRTLADRGRHALGRRDGALQQLREEALRLQFRSVLPLIDKALGR